jgi:hypothetical protein
MAWLALQLHADPVVEQNFYLFILANTFMSLFQHTSNAHEVNNTYTTTSAEIEPGSAIPRAVAMSTAPPRQPGLRKNIS